MSRVLVCSCRIGEDKDTHDQVLYIATWKMPSYTEKGVLWYPKKEESVLYIVIRRSEKPQTFEEFRMVRPGALLDVFYAVNDFTSKSYVNRYEIVPGSDVHKIEDLYLHAQPKAANNANSGKKSGKDSDLPF